MSQSTPIDALTKHVIPSIVCPHLLFAMSHVCSKFYHHLHAFRQRFLSLTRMFRTCELEYERDQSIPVLGAFEMDVIARVLYPFRFQLPVAAIDRADLLPKTVIGPVVAHCTPDTHVVGCYKCDTIKTLEWPTLSGFGTNSVRDRFMRVVYPKLAVHKGSLEAAACIYQHNMLRCVDAAVVMRRLCDVYGCDGDHESPYDEDKCIFPYVWVPEISTAKRTNMKRRQNPRYNAQIAKKRALEQEPIVLAVLTSMSHLASDRLSQGMMDFILYYGMPARIISGGGANGDTVGAWAAKHRIPHDVYRVDMSEPSYYAKRAARVVSASTHIMSFDPDVMSDSITLHLARMQHKFVIEIK